MELSRVTELHYITPLTNVPSIRDHGLLSHSRAEQIPHESVAWNLIQDRRAMRSVPGGRRLHDYVNLYFDARNPMMSKLKHDQGCEGLVVLRISPRALGLPGVVVTDGNASSDYTVFRAPAEGITKLDESRVYATYWTDPDTWAYFEKKRQRCAEVLVPDTLPTRFVTGVYANSAQSLNACRTMGFQGEVYDYVFFD